MELSTKFNLFSFLIKLFENFIQIRSCIFSSAIIITDIANEVIAP